MKLEFNLGRIMKNKLVKLGLLVLLLSISLSSTAAQYQIESATLRYERTPFSVGPIDEDVTLEYSLSGLLEIELDTVTSFSSGREYQTLSFSGSDLISTAPADQPFELSSLTALFNGDDFGATFCGYSIAIVGGSCFEAGNIESYSGSLSNGILTLSGNAPIDLDFSYIYEITATAVPLPGGALLYLSCLLSCFFFRQFKNT